ncbi:MAG: class I SAM-dependent methyltransferase [Nocardioides sp.]|nr:class I SAM-dependent methyltransferase [Nocardioides sp.]
MSSPRVELSATSADTLHLTAVANGPAPAVPLAVRMSTAHALDLAFAGEPCELVQANGTTKMMSVDGWIMDASPADLELFVDPCHGPTLDVGCGPGRLTGALTDRGVRALGIDISREAVRQTRQRGGDAVCCDVFSDLDALSEWQHIVLADGNIGIGGDPVQLLTRVGQLLSRHGTVLVELARDGISMVHEDVRLRVGEHTTAPFGWATVGVDALEEVAASADFTVTDVRHAAGRPVATLSHRAPLRVVTTRP